MKSIKLSKESSSFRDPSGFVFREEGIYYRQVNFSYKENFDSLINSGLYKELVDKKLLISHKISSKFKNDSAYKILEPEQIAFISYPYEWSFSQLKDAALLTLEIQAVALKFGMSLKDASAYNVQFLGHKPIFIDTLSFERYEENKPWVAYKQFCQHFLAPLALISKTDLRMGTLSQLCLDGIPLDLAACLLPQRTKLSFGLGAHIHLHAKSQKKHEATLKKSVNLRLPKNQLLAIIESLKSTVSSLKLPKQKTVWDDYYQNTNYSSEGFQHKEKVIAKWITQLKPKSIWDVGANDGNFSRLGSKRKIFTVATDFDPMAIEQAYLRAKSDKDDNILPLIIDIANPSPAIGWSNTERNSFLSRSSFDLTLCLALVHHLAISNNLPFSFIAKLLAEHTAHLIIEFVPKEDSNTKRLLANREDIFASYDQKTFEKTFSDYFQIEEKASLKESKRTLYLMKRKD